VRSEDFPLEFLYSGGITPVATCRTKQGTERVFPRVKAIGAGAGEGCAGHPRGVVDPKSEPNFPHIAGRN
jgi:hypothetical protein